MARKRSKPNAPKPVRSRQIKRSQLEAEEVAQLDRLIKAGAPVRSAERVQPGQSPAEPLSYADVRKFRDLPISKSTIRGLADNDFKHLTAIQRACIPHALCGRDILGAAKTGSGKTLAFLVPVCVFAALSVLFHSPSCFADVPEASELSAELQVGRRSSSHYIERGGRSTTVLGL